MSQKRKVKLWRMTDLRRPSGLAARVIGRALFGSIVPQPLPMMFFENRWDTGTLGLPGQTVMFRNNRFSSAYPRHSVGGFPLNRQAFFLAFGNAACGLQAA